jgi:hypothetical protein
MMTNAQFYLAIGLPMLAVLSSLVVYEMMGQRP